MDTVKTENHSLLLLIEAKPEETRPAGNGAT